MIPEFPMMMQSQKRHGLLADLNGRSKVDAFEAAKRVWSDLDSNLARPLIEILRRGRNPFNRAAAAHALPVLRDLKSLSALERTVSMGQRVQEYAARLPKLWHTFTGR